MESTAFLEELIGAVMVLIRSGVILRCVYLFVRMIEADDNQDANKKKMKNTIIFYIFAEAVNELRSIAEHYFL